jgi:hypothetical protein
MRRALWSKSSPLLILATAVGAGIGCAGTVGGLGVGGQPGNNGTGGGSSSGFGGSGGTAGSNGGFGGSSNGSGGRTTTGGSGGTTGAGGATGNGGATTGVGGTPGLGGGPGAGGAPACSTSLASRVRITEIDVGVNYAYNEVDNNGAALGQTPLAISPIPGGGSRLAFLGKTDSMAHVVTLDTLDQPIPGTAFALPAFDFQDIYADATGGVMLVSRNALGSTDNHNCGNINNLCGLVANYPIAASCYDLYIVRFNGTAEAWATKLTQTSATLPAYGISATTGGNVIFIWSEYAHNGRIAFDGTNYASYFGAAITVPNQACVGSSTLTTGVNIHQGDRMQAVNGSTGMLLTTPGFSFGCSHSGYERILWDPINKVFVNVCKNDLPTGGKSGKIGFAPNAATIVPIDLNYDQIGSVINATGGGYWIFESDIRPGQTPNANGMADIHLLHVPKVSTPMPDKDIVAVSDGQNDRAPHLAPYGTAGTQMLAAWESSTALGDFSQNAARQMSIQVLDSTTGGPAGADVTSFGPLKLTPNVLGSRYQDFRSFPDGSVAYPAPGSTATKIKILRVLGCSG